MATYSFPHRHRFHLAKEVARLLFNSTGQNYLPHFLSSGTEAVEAALEVAIAAKKRKRSVIVSFYNSFHGNTLQSRVVSGKEDGGVFLGGDGNSRHYIKLPYYSRQNEYNNSFNHDLDRALTKYNLKLSDVATVLIEPYQGKGVYVAHSSFMRDVSDFCINNAVLLIVDEIQSGFYRTGCRFAVEHFNIKPDILCLGKGITSSLPMSAIAIKTPLTTAVSEVDIATTHSANPLSCVAALANIKYLEDDKFKKHLERVEYIFEDRIRGISKNMLKYIEYVEVYGMVASIHIAKDGRPSPVIAKAIAQTCHDLGLFVSLPNGETLSFLRFTPPLTITARQLTRALNILDNAIRRACHDLS